MKKKIVIYGETHGQMEMLYPKMRAMNPDAHEIIIAGEEGFGFGRDEVIHNYAKQIQKRPYLSFIRGNHSDPDACKLFTTETVRYIPDGTIRDGILFVGGAYSIDRDRRTPGLDWWYGEELSEQEFEAIIENVWEHRHEIHMVVSHDCPRGVQRFILPKHKTIVHTRTDFYLDKIRQILTPFIHRWFFAHYHISTEFLFEGVFYTCLPDQIGAKAVIEV